MLRLMALAYLKLENGVLALQCVQTQRTLPPRLSEQHSVPHQALQALLLLGRTQDAETELQAVISHKVCFHSACLDSSTALFCRNPDGKLSANMQEAPKDLCLDALRRVLAKQQVTGAVRAAVEALLTRFSADPAFVCSLIHHCLDKVKRSACYMMWMCELRRPCAQAMMVLRLRAFGMQAARDSDELDELALSVLGQEAVLAALNSVRCISTMPLAYTLYQMRGAKINGLVMT